MFLPDDPESNTRNVDNDNEEKVLVTPEDLMTEQPGSCLSVCLLSITSGVEHSVFLVIIIIIMSRISRVEYKSLLDYDDTGISQFRPRDVYQSLACSSLVDLGQLLGCDGLGEGGAATVTRHQIYLR